MKKQKGINIVEFAIVSLLFFTLLFGIIEFARMMFIVNTLGEATRRGARIAAVCPIDALEIKRVVLFSSAPNTIESGNIINIGINDITVSYLKKDFSPETGSDYDAVAFVQVSIKTNNLAQTLAIPGVSSLTIIPPSITTTLPRESLGRTTANNPTSGVVRSCFFKP